MRSLAAAAAILLATIGEAQTWHFRHLAGTDTGGGYADGAARAARFSTPGAVVACGGAIYVADAGNHAIRRLSPDGNVSTWSGALTESGSADGDRTIARFRYPAGIAADNDCNLYVADSGNHTIRKITAAGQVTTLAGRAGTSGTTDAVGDSARFNAPEGIAVDTDGSLWIADSGNHAMRRMTSDRRVRTMVNTLKWPRGIAVDSDGSAIVADYTGHAVVRVMRDGKSANIASSSTLFPSAVAFDRDHVLYVLNYTEEVLQRVEGTGDLTIVAGTRSQLGSRDGTGGEVLFDHPRGLSYDAATDSFLLVDEFAGTVRRATTAGQVTTIAGTAAAGPARVDGRGNEARFVAAGDIDVDAGGVAYVADSTAVRRIARDGTVTTLAGANGEFRGVSALAVEPSGSLVVVDGNAIRRVTQSGEVTTIAGSVTQSGNRDDSGTNALFNFPVSLAVAADGTIYVADAFNRAIRKIAGDRVTTLATSNESFTPPMGALDVDAAGNVYLWNENAPSVFRITPAGAISTVATDASLNTLANGLAVAADGTIYIGGFRTHSIYRVAPGSSKIERFAGDDVAIGNQNGTPAEARFRSPTRLDVAPDGRLFVLDANRAVRVGSTSEPPRIDSFTAFPAAIHPGEPVTLTWMTTGGSARLEPAPGEVASTGSLIVSPSRSTTYALIVTNDGGEVRAEVTVNVAGPRQRVTRH